VQIRREIACDGLPLDGDSRYYSKVGSAGPARPSLPGLPVFLKECPGRAESGKLLTSVQETVTLMKGASIAALTAFVVVATVAVAAAAPPHRPDRVRRTNLSRTQVRLTWQDNSNNESGFEILRHTQLHEGFQSRGTVGANVQEFTDDVQQGTVYTYRVRAFNADGDSDNSNDCFVGRTPPNVPLSVWARYIALSVIRVSWTDASQTEAGFLIQRADEGHGFHAIAVVPANAEYWDDDTLSSAHTYTYRVRALGRLNNCIDNSRFSVARTATTKGGVRILTVDMTGSGRGTVRSIPEGIHCGPQRASCSAEFPIATPVTLIADPSDSSRFKKWLDITACEHEHGPCTLNMGKDRIVTAVFKKNLQ